MANAGKDKLIDMIKTGASMTLKQQLRLTVALSTPAILAQLSMIVMEYIDSSMVGRLGANDSASIGLVATSMWLFGGLLSAAAMGFTVQVPTCLELTAATTLAVCCGSRWCAAWLSAWQWLGGMPHQHLPTPLAWRQRCHLPQCVALFLRPGSVLAVSRDRTAGWRNVAQQRQHESARNAQHTHVRARCGV